MLLAGLYVPVAGFLWGTQVVYFFGYAEHLVAGVFLAAGAWCLLRWAPDGDVWLGIGVGLILSLALLAVGHFTAYESYRLDGTTVWQAIEGHLEAGVSTGDGIRSGAFALLAWGFQALTLPLFVLGGTCTGTFIAHDNSSSRRKDAFETLTDQLIDDAVEQQQAFQAAVDAIPVPKPAWVRPDLLLFDLIQGYRYFMVPILLTLTAALLLSGERLGPLVPLFVSLIMLQSANAVLTGHEAQISFRIGAVFEQFFLYTRAVVLLFFAAVLGMAVTAICANLVGVDGDFETPMGSVTNVGAMIGALVLFDRIWPMLVMHFLYSDVDQDANRDLQDAAISIGDNFWFGSPGAGLRSAWQLTRTPGSFARATVPVIFTILLVGGVFGFALDSAEGWNLIALQLVLCALVAPMAYLLVMDRALALRHSALEHRQLEVIDEQRVTPPDDARLMEFLQAFPAELRSGIQSGKSLGEVGESILAQKILAECRHNPHRLLEQAILHNQGRWFVDALRQGANVNSLNQEGRPLVVIATQRNRLLMLKRLIELGADIEASDEHHDQAIHVACEADERLEVLQLLVQSGASLHSHGWFDHTPLHRASWHGSVGIAKWLLDRGAAVEAQSEAGTPLSLAVRRAHEDMIELLLTALPDPETTLQDRSLLRLALQPRNPAVMTQLLDAGVNLQIRFEQNSTLLMQAASLGNLALIQRLLERGADPNDRDDAGRRASAYAIDWDGKQAEQFRACHQLLIGAEAAQK